MWLRKAADRSGQSHAPLTEMVQGQKIMSDEGNVGPGLRSTALARFTGAAPEIVACTSDHAIILRLELQRGDSQGNDKQGGHHRETCPNAARFNVAEGLNGGLPIA